MSEQVQFEEGDSREYNRLRFYEEKQRGVVPFLLRLGIVKNNKQALIVASVIAGVVLITAGFSLRQSLTEPQIIEIRVK